MKLQYNYKVELFFPQKSHLNRAVKASRDTTRHVSLCVRGFFSIILIVLHNIFIRTTQKIGETIRWFVDSLIFTLNYNFYLY